MCRYTVMEIISCSRFYSETTLYKQLLRCQSRIYKLFRQLASAYICIYIVFSLVRKKRRDFLSCRSSHKSLVYLHSLIKLGDCLKVQCYKYVGDWCTVHRLTPSPLPPNIRRVPHSKLTSRSGRWLFSCSLPLALCGSFTL